MLKVAVIGAGLSGLVTSKELLAEGHEVICFEKSHDIGGVFNGSGAYDSLHLTVSNYFMSFSDFMPYDEDIRFWTCAEYKAYLDRYAKHFGLLEHMQFGRELETIRRTDKAKIEVTLRTEQGTQEKVLVDRVAVCSGQFGTPNIPSLAGSDSFPGQVLHSGEYKSTEAISGIADKRVLCLGLGESAADIVAEIAGAAKRTVLSIRRHHLVAARCVFQPGVELNEAKPGAAAIDVLQSRWYHSQPASTKARNLRALARQLRATVSNDSGVSHWLSHLIKAADEPGAVVTKTARVFDAVAEHGLEIDVGGIEQIQGNTVTFISGRREDFDMIMLCTGYSYSPSYLDEGLQFADIRDCYLQMFTPELRDQVAVIGVVRPQQGGVPLMAELQARYFALLCSGKRELPEDLASLARRDAQMWRREFYETPEVAGLVNGLRYNEILARLIGCRPPEPSLWRSPRAYFRYWFAHVWPSQFRLCGPGASPEAQKRWLEAPYSPVVSLPMRLVGVLMMYYWRARSLISTDPKRIWRPIRDSSDRPH